MENERERDGSTGKRARQGTAHERKKGGKKNQKPYREEVDLALCFRRGFKSWV